VPRALLDDLRVLAETAAPTGAEEPRLAWLEQRLATAPGARSRDAVGNLLWRLGEGRPALMLLAHVDTVFGAEVDVSVREEGGWLHGAGIGDNAAAVAVAVDVVERLAPRLQQPLVVVFTVGEEGLGNLRGALHASRELQPERAIALEGHGVDEVCVDAVGSLRARLAVRGPGGHSWWDRGRPSALHALVSMLTVLLAEGTPEAPLNIGRVTGGGAINAIAADAEATIEVRSLDERALDAFTKQGGKVVGDLPSKFDAYEKYGWAEFGKENMRRNSSTGRSPLRNRARICALTGCRCGGRQARMPGSMAGQYRTPQGVGRGANDGYPACGPWIPAFAGMTEGNGFLDRPAL